MNRRPLRPERNALANLSYTPKSIKSTIFLYRCKVYQLEALYAEGGIMAIQATLIKIMIASPSDIDNERKFVREVICEWNTTHVCIHKKVLSLYQRKTNLSLTADKTAIFQQQR